MHTGQHYDPVMSGSFFTDLNMPAPDIFLNVDSGSHPVQTAEILKRFEVVLLREKLAHVESGLRSFDRLMPEDVNRVVTDHVSDLLLVTEESGVRNLPE